VCVLNILLRGRSTTEIAGSEATNPHITDLPRWCGVVFKALRYKPAGRGFASPCVIGIFQ
jgi:hypothetical protein